MFERDEKGLVKGLEYKYDEQGLIDWRAMLDDKWLYPNPSSVEKGICKRNTPVSQSRSDMSSQRIPVKHLLRHTERL